MKIAASILVALLALLPVQRLDTAELDRVEDLSESLANDLLALSLAARDRDKQRMAGHFGERVTVHQLPLEAQPAVAKGEWLQSHGWQLEQGWREISRQEMTEALAGVLAHFDSIEDARFKVKQAQFDDPAVSAGTARIKFFIVGRDQHGHREWLVAWANIQAHRVDEEAWQIDRFAVESMTSMVADRDLFSEVALPAGVHARFPDFGVPPNETVVAHGAAVADVNNDGLLDLIATGVERNVLYLNDGAGGFRDVSDQTFVALTRPATGAVFFDADNDGDQDLFLATVGRQMYLENLLVPEGELLFLDRSLEAGVDLEAIGFSVAVADVNNDGRPDVHVASYNRYGLIMPDSWWDARNGTPNLLFINEGQGRFREAGAEWGVRDGRWSYAAAFADIDGDGDQDLYLANDFGQNAMYLNEGDHFRDVAAERGVLDPGNGMGVAFGDFNNDGHLDLHVTNMSSTAGNRILGRLFPQGQSDSPLLKKLASGNSLYQGDGAGGFTDVTQAMGGFSAGWAWGGGFIDVDNDGWEDLYAPNGFISGKTMNDT